MSKISSNLFASSSVAFHDIPTPDDHPDVLVAMNPAALKANVADVPEGGTVIVDTHDFTERAGADRVGVEPDHRRYTGQVHRPRDRLDPVDVGRAGRHGVVA